MTSVKIIKGVFGWKSNKGYKLVRAGDPPINVDDVLAKRLVERAKVAEYVPVKEAPMSEETTINNENSKTFVSDEFETMNPQNLRAVGKEYGLTFPVGITKSEMINAIRNAVGQSENNFDDDTDNSSEEIIENNSDEVPTFDAAEAVQ